MYHDPSRLLKIELWSRRLAWYFLAVGSLIVIGSTIKITVVLIYPGLFGLSDEYINYIWARPLIVTENIVQVFRYLFAFLLLQGISKTIRYLLALNGELLRKLETNLSQ